MIRNFLKVIFRNMKKNKMFTIINIVGLSVGIAGFLLIFSYVKYELEYDTFHKDAERIFRVVTDVSMRNGSRMNTSLTSPMAIDYLQLDFPRIQSATRIVPAGETSVKHGENIFYEEAFWFVDSTFFDVFDFEVIEGDKNLMLKNRNSIVMTNSVARKYFGEKNPIGQTVIVNADEKFTVTGIVKDLPSNSHLRFEVLAYYPGLRSFGLKNWGALSLYTYVKLNKSDDSKVIDKGFTDFVTLRMGEQFKDIFKLHLEPMLSIHLHSQREHDFSARTDVQQIYIFSIVAFLIVIVACINFMNLSIARSSKRTLEIGVRKVLGAERKQLIFQHLGESVILTSMAVSLSVVLYFLLLPELNNLSGLQIGSKPFIIFVTSLIIVVSVGVLSGFYPALVLSSFKPINILCKSGVKTKSGNYLRKGLVIFQFTVTIGLLICTGIVYRQMEYIRDKDQGFTKEGIVFIQIRDDAVQIKIEVLKNELRKLVDVENVFTASTVPGFNTHQNAYNLPDSGGQAYVLHTIYADDNFIKALKISMVEGRDFSKEFTTEIKTGIIINETAAKRFSWKEPVGKELHWAVDAAMNDTTRVIGKVVGVVRDFHFQSMFNKIEPLVIRYDISLARFIGINIRTYKTANIINSIKRVWEKVYPDIPVNCQFLKDVYNDMYDREIRQGKMFSIFTLLAISISCLGLLGLATFAVERKTKEIGIRKVMGASISNIVTKLSVEYSFLVLISNILAWPISFYLMKNWMERFEYRTGLSLIPFIISAIIVFILAFSVVGIISAKAAMNNPVKVLRDE